MAPPSVTLSLRQVRTTTYRPRAASPRTLSPRRRLSPSGKDSGVAYQGDDANYALITGGSGFIGSYLAQSLLEDEKCDRVILFDRDPDLRRITGFGIDPRRFTFVQGDLSIQNHVLEVFDRYPPRAVYHLGALLSAGAEANPTMGVMVDLVGTWHVLEAARFHLEAERVSAPVKVLFPARSRASGNLAARARCQRVHPGAGNLLWRRQSCFRTPRRTVPSEGVGGLQSRALPVCHWGPAERQFTPP
jgi:hypothetical protein